MNNRDSHNLKKIQKLNNIDQKYNKDNLLDLIIKPEKIEKPNINILQVASIREHEGEKELEECIKKRTNFPYKGIIKNFDYTKIREKHKDFPTWLTPINYAGEPISDAGQSAGGDPNRYAPTRPGIYKGREILINRNELEGYLQKKETLAGTWALEAIRIAAGVARVVVDADHKTIPHEIGLIGNAVHLEKGCYRGQETVARVHNLGKPPRKLVLIHLDGSPNRLPKIKSPIIVDGVEVGVIGSSAQHYELGPIALGIVKSKTEVLLNVAVDEIPGTIQEVVVAQ